MQTLSEEWKKKFVVNLKGKEFVTYAGLIDVATQMGLCGVETTLVQTDTQNNDFVAIVTAKVYRTVEGGTWVFTGIGDASKKNVSANLHNCLPRFAETRAVCRALRLMTNIGMTALEEMELEDEKPSKPNTQSQANTSTNKQQQEASDSNTNADATSQQQARQKPNDPATPEQLERVNKRLIALGSAEIPSMTFKEYKDHMTLLTAK